ncbi:TPA: hypothetical protein ACOTG6_001805 [Clostridium perfringens]
MSKCNNYIKKKKMKYISLGINVSAIQLLKNAFINEVREILN